MVCVCILLREHPKAQPKVVLEKTGIEPATTSLQGITLIHYTTAALCKSVKPLINIYIYTFSTTVLVLKLSSKLSYIRYLL